MDKPQICISTDFYIVYAFMLLLLPVKWVVAWVLSTLTHELFHIFALLLCKRRIRTLRITATGASIYTEYLTGSQDIFCSLAGPIGGLSLLFFAEKNPQLALCAVWQNIYNLLPIGKQDGSRAVYRGLQLLFREDTVYHLHIVIHYTVLIGVCLFGLWASTVLKLGLLPVVISVLIVIRNRKTPCKEDFQAVQ